MTLERLSPSGPLAGPPARPPGSPVAGSPSDDLLRRLILTAAGLAALAAAFVFAVPRRAEIAASMAPAAASSAIELDVPEEMPPETRADAGNAETAAAASRDVTPDALAGAAGDAGALRRLPPRPAPEPVPPLTEPAPADLAAPATPPRPPKPMRVLSRPIAVETATFLVGKARISLSGVEAPPASRECQAGGGRTWPCGMQARTALRSWLRARSIRCDVPKDFATSASQTRSECALGTKDIGAWLVENGWAAAEPGSRYVPAERNAKALRLGIWGGG